MALTLRGGYVSANLDSNGKEEMGLRDMLIFSRLSSPEEVNKLALAAETDPLRPGD